MSAPRDPFAGPGELRALCRALDWSATPLGPVDRWPLSLRNLVQVVLGSPTAMIVLWGPELVQVYNDAYRDIMGAKHPAGLGMRNRDCWGEVWDFTSRVYEGVMQRGESFTFVDQRLVLERGSGPAESFWSLGYGPVSDDEGRVGGVLCTVLETTDAVRARSARERERDDLLRAVQEGAERLRAIYDGTHTYIGLLTPDGVVLDVNAASLRFDDIPRDRVIGKAFWETPWWAYTPGGPERARHAVAAAARGEFVRDQIRVRRPDGSELEFDFSLHPVLDGDGRVIYLVPEGRDVTAIRRMERALGDNEARLRLALDVAELGTWSWDLATGDGFIDDRGGEIVGLEPGEVVDIGRAQANLIHPDDVARVQAEASAGVASGQPFELRYRVTLPDGRERHVASRARVVRDGEGNPQRLVGTNRDVTDEQEAAARLRASEARYRALFERMEEGFCVVEVLFDADGVAEDYRFLEANPAFVQQTGLTDPVGRTMNELVPGGDSHWFEIFGRVARTGAPASFEAPATALGRWYDVNAFRVAAPEDHRVAIFFRDVSQRKQAEAERERLVRALEVERERLVEVIRQAPAFMVVLRGPEHVLELANDAYRRLVGTRDDIGKPLFEALPEMAGQGFERLLERVLETGEPFVGRELPLRLARGAGEEPETRVVDVAYVPLAEPDGARVGIVVCGTDVTDQVRARREVERARDRAERLQALTAALAGARTLDDVADVVVADMVVALGARTGALAGRTMEGDALVLLRTIGFAGDVRAGVQRQPLDMQSPLTACFRTRAPIFIERRDGDEGLDRRYPLIAPVWDALGVSSAAFVPLVAAGEPVGVISFAFERPRAFEPAERDFLRALGQQAALAVERARLFDAERAAREEAERANRAKGEFLAVMSHELRTPLNAIGGYAELLELGLRGPVTEQQRADLARIQQSQRHLLGLINQVLNYTRVDAGAVRYDLTDVPVIEALAAAEALIIPQVRARGLVYVLAGVPNGDGGRPLAVRADREKLQQILLNLLSNAVKFTESGGEVRVGATRDGDRVRIAVADSGIGISEEKLAHVFEPFVQVDQRLTRPHEGVGLGLSISRDLARGMGGDLTATSTPGAGSTFELELPVG